MFVQTQTSTLSITTSEVWQAFISTLCFKEISLDWMWQNKISLFNNITAIKRAWHFVQNFQVFISRNFTHVSKIQCLNSRQHFSKILSKGKIWRYPEGPSLFRNQIFLSEKIFIFATQALLNLLFKKRYCSLYGKKSVLFKCKEHYFWKMFSIKLRT